MINDDHCHVYFYRLYNSFILHFSRFSVDKLSEQKLFRIDFTFTLTLEEETTVNPILRDFTLPVPICNQDIPFSLPGDGSIQGFVKRVGRNFTQTAVDVVLHQLGVKVIINNRLI